jgi:hypothetical protein
VIHGQGCDCDTYGCRLRRKGIGFSADATPTHRSRRPFRSKTDASWEAGKSGERRADGSFMPYLNDRGTPIGVKEYGERRRELTDIRRRQVSGPPTQE